MFHFMGNPISFLDEIHDSGQAPIRQYEAVTPLGDYFPREFAFPRVKSEGQLQFIIRELWNDPVWWQLSGFASTFNIVDVYNANSDAGAKSKLTCSTIIRKPYGVAAVNAVDRGWTYQNTNLITIDDREVVQIGALTMPRTITAVYSNKLYFPAPGYSGPGQTPSGDSLGNQSATVGQFAAGT
jgi:hypothetical protein